MSYLKANTAGVYDIPSANIDTLYVKGKKFQQYINELVFEDQLEASEIVEIKLLLEYLDTTGLNTAWTVTNSNVNETLRSAITALQTKLANIDSTALTQSSVLTNDNRNSVLKTAIDTATSDLTALTTRVTTAEGDIDGVETKTRFITEASIVGTGNNTLTNFKTKVGPAGSEAQGIVFVEHNMKNAPSGELIGYSMASNFTVTSNENFGSNESFYSHYDGRLTIGPAHTIRVQASDQVRIGTFADRDAFSEMDIKIGGRGNKVNIGSVDSQNATGPITEVWIGHDGGNTGRNTETSLEGNLYIGNGYFPQLPKSNKYTWTQLASYIKTVGLPAWVVSFALTSSIPNFEYSDCWVLKDGSTGSNKKGDVTTSNDPKLQSLVIFNSSLNIARLTPVEGTFVGSGTISKTTLNGSIRNSCFLDGGGDNKIAFKHHNIAASDIIDWATTEANDKCNVIEIGGNSGILIHQGASNSETPLQIINSKSGPIKMLLNNDGTRGGAISGVEIMPYETGGVFGSQTRIGFYPLADPTGSQQLEVNQPLNRDGIVVQYYTYPGGATKNVINYNSITTPGTITGINLVGSTSVSTPSVSATSLVISGNYTGDTTNRLYKNADNKLFWNGVELGSNLGGGGGGLEYYIPLANNVTNPAPNPTAQTATETYTNAPQRTITQSTTAVGTGLRMARYLTGLINKDSNPFVEGLQTIQQYLTWSENNTVGQLYGQAWFQAEATGASSFVYERTYSDGVTANGPYVLNGTPIPAPNGLFNLSINSVVFPNIDINHNLYGPDQGPVRLKCRLEGQDLITENWNILQTSTTELSYSSDITNQTLTFTENFIRNQTTKTNAPIAYRFVLFVSSQISPYPTGDIKQTNSGSTNSDQVAYKLGSVAGATASIRVLLYDGENAKQTIAHTITPSLVPIELPISPPYQIGAFNNGRLAFDVFMYQPSGAVNANHQMTFFFGEGTISHIETTINEPPAPVPTLAQVLNSGATASQPINMDGRAITGITTLEGSSNGNWNVKELTAGTGVSVSPASGTYTIANTGILSVAASGSGITSTTSNGAVTLQNTGVLSVASASGSGISVSTSNGVATLANTGILSVAAASGTSGISVSTANGIATLQNSGILSITAGTGISVSTTNGVAQITSTATAGTTQATVLQNIREDNLALGEIGAHPRKPDYWATNWSIADEAVRSHYDSYLSVDGKVIATASGNFTIRYSTNYGTSWNDGNVGGGYLSWYTICGTTNGSKLFAFGRTGTTGQTLVFYTSVTQGATWSQVTSDAFAGLNTVNRVRCSGDGRYLIASVGNVGTGVRYLSSSDSGATWELKTINATIDVGFTQGVNVSRSGAVQYITWTFQEGNVSRVYRSLDYGTTWTQVNENSGNNQLFTYIESDSTGRFVWVARYINISTLGSAGYRSDDYGVTWYTTGFGSCEDIWVSATGQFAAGISIANPGQSNNRFLCITVDYGMSTQYVNLGNTTSFRTIHGSADGSILVLGSVNFSEAGYSSDGKIRIARQAPQNIQDLAVVGGTLTKSGGVYSLNIPSAAGAEELWYTGIVNMTSNADTVYFDDFRDIKGKIDLNQYNLRYEMDINWNWSGTGYPPAFIGLGLNSVQASTIANPASNNAQTLWTRQTQPTFSTTQNNPQVYTSRFFCGFSDTIGTGADWRFNTTIKGLINLTTRTNPQYTNDPAMMMRQIRNDFVCSNTLLEPASGTTNPFRLYTGNDVTGGQVTIRGSAIWEASFDNLWTLGSSGGNDLNSGVFRLYIRFTNEALTNVPRGAEIKYSIYRVNKGIANSV